MPARTLITLCGSLALFSEQFDLIINFNFLLRELIPKELRALAPGGVLIIDTIMESPELLASHNPAYLLRRGELQRIFQGLEGEILFSEEQLEGETPTARILFRKANQEQDVVGRTSGR